MHLFLPSVYLVLPGILQTTGSGESSRGPQVSLDCARETRYIRMRMIATSGIAFSNVSRHMFVAVEGGTMQVAALLARGLAAEDPDSLSQQSF
jgi:hypothetical protein